MLLLLSCLHSPALPADSLNGHAGDLLLSPQLPPGDRGVAPLRLHPLARRLEVLRSGLPPLRENPQAGLRALLQAGAVGAGCTGRLGLTSSLLLLQRGKQTHGRLRDDLRLRHAALCALAVAGVAPPGLRARGKTLLALLKSGLVYATPPGVLVQAEGRVLLPEGVAVAAASRRPRACWVELVVLRERPVGVAPVEALLGAAPLAGRRGPWVLGTAAGHSGAAAAAKGQGAMASALVDGGLHLLQLLAPQKRLRKPTSVTHSNASLLAQFGAPTAGTRKLQMTVGPTARIMALHAHGVASPQRELTGVLVRARKVVRDPVTPPDLRASGSALALLLKRMPSGTRAPGVPRLRQGSASTSAHPTSNPGRSWRFASAAAEPG
mmetsp:Transcript_25171/g.75123  ORF Transcript_25171/g.75123 Transcript_25171/m.75123 type:complete len:380 (-) Transcript_25171:614-1753(-)